ncbi:MAG: ORF6N domain-containing protein [Burkholderiales bacterium]|jgi:hypothetical protein
MTPDKKSPIALREESLRGLIHTLRAEQVMLDRDLATLYQVETRALKQAVKRNIRRFPDDFMFVLEESEVDMLVSQSVIPTKGVLGGAMPFAFTEQGVAALSSVLTSERAIEVNIAIMRAFVSMRRLLASSTPLLDRLETLEKRQMAQEIRTDDRFEQLFTALETANVQPVQGIFFDGQVFDAYVFVNDLLRRAQRSIILIDNFIDDSVLLQLAKRSQGVSATVLTKKISPQLEQDLKKHNSQYPSIRVEAFPHSHDRFLILDDEAVYHIGASLKDLRKKWFAFSRMDTTSLSMMARVREVLK